ncbi:MAG: pyridoxamine 5'-phosphate oxidase family protein [Gammaproteobacteria bacterium]|nr:pyridoxamine 5'-phosphate oxidase family protein [Gammaproteobacteria bacterium]
MIYDEQHRRLQREFDSERLADRVRDIIVAPELSDEHRAFIESREMFFLTSIDHRGFPTCSYKGGAPGFVRVSDSRTIAFPSYNGNGMFLSLGNIAGNDKVGMLFMDFETPHRVRIHGTASVDRSDPLIDACAGAELIVRVRVSEVFVNCPRYIPTYRRMAASKYVPRAGQDRPPAPQWKRIDAVQDALPDQDRGVAEQLGGTITPEAYAALLKRNEA